MCSASFVYLTLPCDAGLAVMLNCQRCLSHRVKTACGSAITGFHSVAMIFAITVKARAPCLALLVEMLLGRLAAFSVVDRASAMVAAYARSVDMVVDSHPFRQVVSAAIPALDPSRCALPAHCARAPFVGGGL